MSETARIDALLAVAADLRALAGRVPGSRLRAEDWNALVAAVGRVADLGLQSAREVPPASDPGAGSVGLAQLDEEVRRRLDEGAGGDLSLRESFARLDRRIAEMQTRMEALEARLDGLSGRVDDGATATRKRLDGLLRVENQLDGALRMKDEVGGLRSLVGSLRGDLAGALELRSRLVGTNGQAVDLVGLQGRVEDLARFREGWRDTSGADATWSRVVGELEELKADAIGAEDLQEALDTRLAGLGGAADTDALEARLREELTGRVDALADEVGGRVKAEVAAAQGTLADQFKREQAAAESRLRDGLDARVAAVADARVATFADTLPGLVDARVAAVFDARPTPATAGDLADLSGRVTAAVDALAGQGLDRATVDALVAEAVGKEAQAREAALAAGFIRAEQRWTAADAAVGARVDASVEARAKVVEGVVDSRLATERRERDAAVFQAAEGLKKSVAADLQKAVATLRDERGPAITAAVTAATSGLEDRLSARLKVIVADETAALSAELSALDVRLDTRIHSAEANISRLTTRVSPVLSDVIVVPR